LIPADAGQKQPQKTGNPPLDDQIGLVRVPLIRIPKKASRKNSKEVNCSAKWDISGEMLTTNSMLMMVPMAEAVVVSPMARPPSPLQARG
jgi:hypothetical protein